MKRLLNLVLLLLGCLFVTNAVHAQATGTPAVINVLREDEITFRVSSNILNLTVPCDFETNDAIKFLNAVGGFPFSPAGDTGQIEAMLDVDGSLLVDRQLLINLADSPEAKFVLWDTSCGSNFGDYGAKAFFHRIETLVVGEGVSINTLLLFMP